MNREEAITTLKNYIERITGGMFPGEREILVEAFDALRSPWVKTSDRLPTKEDADNRLELLAWDYCAGVVVKYGDVKDNSQIYPYWMPIPPLPEVEE